MSAADPRTLLVADSFRVRVREGRAEVRGFAQHLARFRGSVIEALATPEDHRATEAVADALSHASFSALSTSDDHNHSSSFEIFAVPLAASPGEKDRLDDFLAHAVSRIAAGGEAFPRLELWRTSDGETSYELSERPVPALGSTLQARVAGHVSLDAPTRKGPGIELLGALNRKLGAEALLTDVDGRVREGATTSLIYWTDETEESGHVIEDVNRVDSVTESLILDAAQHRLIGTKPNRQRTGALHLGLPTVAELQRAEVWGVNALHGIRPIRSIDGAALPDPKLTRLRWFREALDRTWEPVS